MPDLSLLDLSGITGRHVETLRRLARTNHLPGVYKLGRRWMITPEAVRKLRRLEAATAAEVGVTP